MHDAGDLHATKFRSAIWPRRRLLCTSRQVLLPPEALRGADGPSVAAPGAVTFLLEHNGGVPGLVALLRSRNLQAAEQAAWAVAGLCGAHEPHEQRSALISAGAIDHLAALAGGAKTADAIAGHASFALLRLATGSRENADRVLSAQGAAALAAASLRSNAGLKQLALSGIETLVRTGSASGVQAAMLASEAPLAALLAALQQPSPAVIATALTALQQLGLHSHRSQGNSDASAAGAAAGAAHETIAVRANGPTHAHRPGAAASAGAGGRGSAAAGKGAKSPNHGSSAAAATFAAGGGMQAAAAGAAAAAAGDAADALQRAWLPVHARLLALGAAPALAALLQHRDRRLVLTACQQLLLLASGSAAGAEVAAAGGVAEAAAQALQQLQAARPPAEDITRCAVRLLATLTAASAGDGARRARHVAARCANYIVALLQPDGDVASILAAISVLKDLGGEHWAAVLTAGAVAKLAALLMHWVAAVQDAANDALGALISAKRPAVAGELAVLAVPGLVALLGCQQMRTACRAAATLAALVLPPEASDASRAMAIATPQAMALEGAVRPLVALLAEVGPSDTVTALAAARLLGSIAECAGAAAAGEAVAAGAVLPLLSLLQRSRDADVSAEAAGALGALAFRAPPAQAAAATQALSSSPSLQALLRLLASPRGWHCAAAATALHALAACGGAQLDRVLRAVAANGSASVLGRMAAGEGPGARTAAALLRLFQGGGGKAAGGSPAQRGDGGVAAAAAAARGGRPATAGPGGAAAAAAAAARGQGRVISGGEAPAGVSPAAAAANDGRRPASAAPGIGLSAAAVGLDGRIPVAIAAIGGRGGRGGGGSPVTGMANGRRNGALVGDGNVLMGAAPFDMGPGGRVSSAAAGGRSSATPAGLPSHVQRPRGRRPLSAIDV